MVAVTLNHQPPNTNMKTFRSILSSSVLLAACTAFSAATAASNSVTEIESSNWAIDLPLGAHRVVVAGTNMTSINCGYAVSLGELVDYTEFTAKVKLSSDRPTAHLVWTVDGKSTAPVNGILVDLCGESQMIWLSYQKNLMYGPDYTGVPMTLPLDTWITIRVVDRSNAVSVYLNGAVEPVATLARDLSVGTSDLHSRKSQYREDVSTDITAPTVAMKPVVSTDLYVTVSQPTTIEALVRSSTPDAVLTVFSEDNTPIAKSNKCDAKTGYSQRQIKKGDCVVTAKLLPGIYVFSVSSETCKIDRFSVDMTELK